MDIKEIYKAGKVKFAYYRKNNLYYNLIMPAPNPLRTRDVNGNYFSNEDEFVDTVVLTFPVPIADCGDATFQDEDKASLFLRYIKEALKTSAPA